MERVIERLLSRKQEIFEGISKESIAAYLFIQEQYAKGKTEDPLFRFVFCEFYQISDRFTTKEWRDYYFTLFQPTDISTLLKKLESIDGKLQFSYATKLIHTVDPTKPIYDSLVAKALRLPACQNKQRFDYYIKTYALLIEIHAALLNDVRISQIIAEFNKFNGTNIAPSKVLDFLIWQLGKLE